MVESQDLSWKIIAKTTVGRLQAVSYSATENNWTSKEENRTRSIGIATITLKISKCE